MSFDVRVNFIFFSISDQLKADSFVVVVERDFPRIQLIKRRLKIEVEVDEECFETKLTTLAILTDNLSPFATGQTSGRAILLTPPRFEL